MNAGGPGGGLPGGGGGAGTDCTGTVVGGPPTTVVVGAPPTGKVVVGAPTGTVVGGPPTRVVGGGGGAGTEAATDCTGLVVGGPPGTVVGGPGGGGAGGVDGEVAGPPIFLRVVGVDVEVVLVRCVAGPKATLLLRSLLGGTTLEVGALVGELGGMGADADGTTSEGRPKRRLEEEEAGDGTDDGRGDVTCGGGPGGADGDERGGVAGG